jgi:heterodisulfide reductase subunit A
MSEVSLEIDGKQVIAEEGKTILEAAKSSGIDIPTLCYHPALSPFGACRMCSVEITSRGRKRIVTSCNYPVENGLIVDTKSPDVIAIRKMMSELLLARCPNVPVIKDLAAKYGIEKPRFKLGDENEKCILCGLCSRICEERIGVSAINFVGRGVNRKVQTPFQGTLDIDMDICISCGSCATVCPTGAITLEKITAKKPIPIFSEFDEDLKLRAPVYIPFAQAIPNAPVIDREKCVHFATGECGICQEVCQAKAIDFDQQDEIAEVDVGAVIIATGYDAFDPSVISQYGYGRYDNVITALQFERFSNASGPTLGKIQLKDGSAPESVAIIHCVGSRDTNYHKYCSRVCCMYALKYSHLIHEKTNAEVYQMYIDMRCFGKGYEEFYEHLSNEGVNFIRGKVAKVTDEAQSDEEKGKLVVVCEDTLLGSMIRVPVDMVVLCTALEPRADAGDVARLFNINRSSDGFFLERHPKLDPVATMNDGMFVVGCCQGPKDIPDTVAQASAAAARVLAMISKGTVEVEAATAFVDEEVCNACGLCVSICAYKAIEIDEKRNVANVNEALCKGCGACAATCPSKAIKHKNWTPKQFFEKVDAATGDYR